MFQMQSHGAAERFLVLQPDEAPDLPALQTQNQGGHAQDAHFQGKVGIPLDLQTPQVKLSPELPGNTFHDPGLLATDRAPGGPELDQRK